MRDARLTREASVPVRKRRSVPRVEVSVEERDRVLGPIRNGGIGRILAEAGKVLDVVVQALEVRGDLAVVVDPADADRGRRAVGDAAARRKRIDVLLLEAFVAAVAELARDPDAVRIVVG